MSVNSYSQSAQKARFETLRSVAFGAVTASFVALGTPLNYPSRKLNFINLSDADIEVSDDGTNPKWIIAASSGDIEDIGTNRNDLGCNLEIPAYTQLYVRYIGSAPTVKGFYVGSMYASTQ